MSSLARAMRAFVQSGCDRSRMNVSAWAATFNAGPEAIRAAWEAAMSEASMGPSNSYDSEGK